MNDTGLSPDEIERMRSVFRRVPAIGEGADLDRGQARTFFTMPKSVGANVASNDRGEIFAWIAGERVFWRASLLDHKGFDIHRHFGGFEKSGGHSP